MGQWEYSKLSGISRGLLSLIETGKRTPPIEKLEDMAKALGLDGEAFDAFIRAGHEAHATDHLRRELEYLRSYANERAAAERRSVAMSFALLRRYAPDRADALIREWTTWPENEQAAAELLRAAIDTQEPRRTP